MKMSVNLHLDGVQYDPDVQHKEKKRGHQADKTDHEEKFDEKFQVDVEDKSGKQQKHKGADEKDAGSDQGNRDLKQAGPSIKDLDLLPQRGFLFVRGPFHLAAKKSDPIDRPGQTVCEGQE